MSHAQVSLGIINYNGLPFLPGLLSSIHAQSFRDFDTLVFDNGSSDDSVSYLRGHQAGVRLLVSRTNLGFSRAGNRLVQESETPLICFLNSDLELDPHWLGGLVEGVEKESELAAVAPKMLLYDQPEHLNGVGGCMNRLGYTWDRGMFEEDRGQYDQPAPVLFAPAAASLFRRSAFQKVGGFDTSMFMYHEDVDLGWRLWLAGYRIQTAPGAVARHHFAATTRASRGMQWREILGERHNLRSLMKNYERANLLRALWGLLTLPQSPARKFAQLENLAWNLARLKSLLKLRRRVQSSRKRSDRELEKLIVQSRDVPIHL